MYFKVSELCNTAPKRTESCMTIDMNWTVDTTSYKQNTQSTSSISNILYLIMKSKANTVQLITHKCFIAS